MGEVDRASKLLGMTPMTLRLFLREGKFGFAVKGTGSHYIYKVDWEEVHRWTTQNKTSSSPTMKDGQTT